MKKLKVLVSSCLLGNNCKYNGENNYNEKLIEFLKDKEVIPVCPELLGGLSVPRMPGEICNGVVLNPNGNSVDMEYRLGAKRALSLAIKNEVDLAILQSRSPSCGVNMIYDGTFSGNLIEGSGVFATLMRENGFKIIDILDLYKIIEA